MQQANIPPGRKGFQAHFRHLVFALWIQKKFIDNPARWDGGGCK
jgi:hypothetical protein